MTAVGARRGRPIDGPVREVPDVIELAELGEWASAWDTLSDRAALPSPFLRSWWLEGIRTPVGRYILVVQGDRLLGGLAVERRRALLGVTRYVAMGSGKLCPDHLDLVIDDRCASAVIDALGRWFARPGSRLLDYEGLVDRSWLATCFPDASLRAHDVSPYEPLPPDYDDYLAARSQTGRGRLRRIARRLDAEGMSCRRVAQDRIDDALEAFWALHAMRSERAEIVSERERIDRAVRSGAACGGVVAYTAEREGQVVAVELEFVARDRLCVYQQARRMGPEFANIGSRLTAFVIQDGCRVGYGELDLLRGGEAYKASLTSHRRELMRLVAARGLRAHLCAHLDEAIASARGGVRRLSNWILSGTRLRSRRRR